jgi:flagellum-specific peptidoglycan hydrolase FlgJ
LFALVVILIVGGALVFVRWLSGDDADNVKNVTEKYMAVIEGTTKEEYKEFRPPLVVVQTIDNMRITKKDLNDTDIDPSIADKLKPDFYYDDYVNTTTTETTVKQKDGTESTTTSKSEQNVKLLVKIHAWNRIHTITYKQVSETKTSTSGTNSDGEETTSRVTITEWVEDDSSQCGTESGGGQSTSSAPAILTGVGSKTSPFFTKYAPGAIEESRKSGIPASITLAQAVQEGGWGTSELTATYYNFFGIKAQQGDGWSGATVLMWTKEFINGVWESVQAPFRAYSSAAEGFADHSKFLLENGRYRTALSKKNPYEFANELQAAGYATDPSYAQNLKNIIHDYNLLQYDLDGGIDPETGKPYEDVGYVGGPGSYSGCDAPDFTKFDAVLNEYNFEPDDVELIAAGINEENASYLSGYNGVFTSVIGPNLVGSTDGSYVNLPPVQPGQMVWPTTARNVTSGFGMRTNPTNGVYKLHKGIDIAPDNSDTRDYPNIAAMDGIVKVAGDSNDGYGYKVVIDHGGGIETLYAHMKVGSLKVSVGQNVKAGTVLGIMGATGDVTARHLHFEVHVNGEPVNPISYVHREAEQ